ncbi:MAG: DUF1553 domain-containing protein [Akkermansiaceae bacterium]|nr:DUF1553 domain-containing protein [Akkermansiaceae bacterium]
MVCHGIDPKTGEEEFKGGLDMRTREAILKGGEFIDDLLVPGDASKSFLITAIKWEDPDFEMPPKENDRLTEEQIALVEQWINLGAPWPDDAAQETIRLAERQREVTEDGVLVETSGGLSDDWTYRRYKPEDVWAFRPVVKPQLPGTANPVDAFVRTKLKSAGYEPAPRAGYTTLIRRATWDLTGLPPTPKEVREFALAWEGDPATAWSDLLDRLLESPRYGERWAQHWLDVARYADTGGFSNDYERSNAWRYRDYVIRAFNDDKPYNEFVIEQIAGDELADASLRKRLKDWNKFQEAREKGDQYNADEAEMLVASSFLRMGPWDPAMVKAPEARQLYIDDVINSVGQTFLATTMRCFKCHDHKFDPLPARDYYRMYAAFAATQLAERPAPFLGEENRNGFKESRAMAKRLHEFADEKRRELCEKRESAAREWYRRNNKEYVSHADRKALPDDEKPPRHVGLSPEEQGRLKVREQDEWIWKRRLERYEPMVQSVYNGPDPKSLNARKLRINTRGDADWRPDSRILGGGALTAPGEKVTPGVFSALGVPVENPRGDPYGVTDKLDGRRLAVARWIADPRNQLTTRSIVNRIWQYHFGKPIAGNPNNFGVKGAKPTHPELLDWLAADFVENGWTFRRLHKLIMMSETYQQSGRHPAHGKLANEDPDNDLFAFFPIRRLSAEEIRDGILKITGELNPDTGGLPARPQMNMEVALQPRMIQFSIAPAYQPSPTPGQRNRRSIYAYRVRGLANPFLETFNRPSPNDSCADRDSASVSPQAFTLMNSDVATARSIAFAQRLEREANTLEDQVKRAVRLAFVRNPAPQELDRLVAYVNEMRKYHRDVRPERPEFPTRITRSLVEEFTGDTFEYEEILPAFENYTPDPHAADVPPDTRALADLCLVLFNSNEFIYLY